MKLILEKLPLSNDNDGKSKVKKKAKKGVEKKLKKTASQGENFVKFRSKLKPALGSILSPENSEKPFVYAPRASQSNASDKLDFNFNKERRNSMLKDETLGLKLRNKRDNSTSS